MKEGIIQRLVDYPVYSKIVLPATATGEVKIPLFDTAPNDSSGNIDAPNQFAASEDYELHEMISTILKGDGTAIVDADRALISNLIRYGWLTLSIGQVKLWSISLSTMHSQPSLASANGASDLVGTLKGGYKLSEPLLFVDGQNFKLELHYDATLDISNLVFEICMIGFKFQQDVN